MPPLPTPPPGGDCGEVALALCQEAATLAFNFGLFLQPGQQVVSWRVREATYPGCASQGLEPKFDVIFELANRSGRRPPRSASSTASSTPAAITEPSDAKSPIHIATHPCLHSQREQRSDLQTRVDPALDGPRGWLSGSVERTALARMADANNHDVPSDAEFDITLADLAAEGLAATGGDRRRGCGHDREGMRRTRRRTRATDGWATSTACSPWPGSGVGRRKQTDPSGRHGRALSEGAMTSSNAESLGRGRWWLGLAVAFAISACGPSPAPTASPAPPACIVQEVWERHEGAFTGAWGPPSPRSPRATEPEAPPRLASRRPRSVPWGAWRQGRTRTWLPTSRLRRTPSRQRPRHSTPPTLQPPKRGSQTPTVSTSSP